MVGQLKTCPRHPGTCALFSAGGFCAHSQEWERILRRNRRWLERTRSGMPSEATSDRAWLVECVEALALSGESE